MDPNVDHQESEAQINVIYIACAGTSVVCCLLVLLCNLCERALSRFPSSLTMWRIVCDLLLSLQFLFVNVLQFMHRHDPPSERSVCSEPLAFLLGAQGAPVIEARLVLGGGDVLVHRGVVH